jgi:hypothetical protein
MGDKKRMPFKWKPHNRLQWLPYGASALFALFLLSMLLKDSKTIHDPVGMHALQSDVCPKPCLDVVIPYHEADQLMFVHNGGLFAAKKHLREVRHIHVLSVSNRTFEHMLDGKIRWYNEAEVPFYNQMVEGKISGWKYQQALKMWSVQHIPGLCNNVLILDADVLWIRDVEVIVPTFRDSEGLCATTRFKYNIATAASGAWESDIYSAAYHSFVEYLTGVPKMNANTLTAINHWQVMQRDVLEALTKSLVARTHYSIEEAILRYGAPNQYDMTEYEAYFSFISYFYAERVETISLPYVIRQPTFCNYFNAPTLSSFLDSDIAYFTCHDKYDINDFYVNCNGKNCRATTTL